MALVISILWRPTSTGRWAEIVPCRAPLTALTAVAPCRLSWLARREAPGSRGCGQGESWCALKGIGSASRIVVTSLLANIFVEMKFEVKKTCSMRRRGLSAIDSWTRLAAHLLWRRQRTSGIECKDQPAILYLLQATRQSYHKTASEDPWTLYD